MKRLVLLAVLALSLGAVVAPAIAGHNAGTGCIEAGGADIVSASVAYTPEGIVAGGPRTATPSCRDVTFTMFVVGYDANGNSTGFIGADAMKGTGAGSAPGPYLVGILSVSGVTAPYVCMFFTSSKGSNVYDIAPDSMCPSSFDPAAAERVGVYAQGDGVPGGGGFYT